MKRGSAHAAATGGTASGSEAGATGGAGHSQSGSRGLRGAAWPPRAGARSGRPVEGCPAEPGASTVACSCCGVRGGVRDLGREVSG